MIIIKFRNCKNGDIKNLQVAYIILYYSNVLTNQKYNKLVMQFLLLCLFYDSFAVFEVH